MRHKPLVTVLGIMAVSALASLILLAANPTMTGMVVFDTGPHVELEPSFISQSDYKASVSTALLVVGAVMLVQAAIYFLINNAYKEDEL